MEMSLIRHFSLFALGSLCIFIFGMCTGPAVHILHPAMWFLRREDYLNHKRVKNNLRVSRYCNFGHQMEPSRTSSEASLDPRSTAKSNASIVPFTTQRFVASYRIMCFESKTDGLFRWSIQPHLPCFSPVSFTQSHLPFPCTTYV